MTRKVLIVEDDFDTAKVLSIRFRAAGFEVRHAVDATLAVKEGRGFQPDIVVLDMMLPAGGGLAVLKAYRLSVYTNLIPIIVYTGMQNEELEKQVTAIGVEGYFQKPYDPQKIVEEAQKILG